jgi:hypothetical protein
MSRASSSYRSSHSYWSGRANQYATRRRRRGSQAYNPGSSAAIDIHFDDASLDDFIDFCDNRAPKECTRLLASAYRRIGKKVAKDIEPFYMRSGSRSLNTGTGYKTMFFGGDIIPGTGTHGKYYGHTADLIRSRAGAIGFGAYARIKIKPDGKWKARINEAGSGGRYAHKWRGKPLHKPRYLGALPSRTAWAAAVESISMAQVNAMTADAVARAIHVASRRRG